MTENDNFQRIQTKKGASDIVSSANVVSNLITK